jgi:hypothetical protein
LALYNIYGPYNYVYIYVYVYGYVYIYGYVYVYVYNYNYSILLIRVDRFNPVKTSKSSNSRLKGFSVARGQRDPWLIGYIEAISTLESFFNYYSLLFFYSSLLLYSTTLLFDYHLPILLLPFC